MYLLQTLIKSELGCFLLQYSKTIINPIRVVNIFKMKINLLVDVLSFLSFQKYWIQKKKLYYNTFKLRLMPCMEIVHENLEFKCMYISESH